MYKSVTESLSPHKHPLHGTTIFCKGLHLPGALGLNKSFPKDLGISGTCKLQLWIIIFFYFGVLKLRLCFALSTLYNQTKINFHLTFLPDISDMLQIVMG